MKMIKDTKIGEVFVVGKGIRVSADKLFDRLQSPFGYDRAMRDQDIDMLASALLDAGIEAILSEDTPLMQKDEAGIAAKLELWFFRDMFQSNRLALFSLFGFKAADMDTMRKQQMVFCSILSSIAKVEGK